MSHHRRRPRRPPSQRPERQQEPQAPEDLTSPRFQFNRHLLDEHIRSLRKEPGRCSICGAEASGGAFALTALSDAQRQLVPWPQQRETTMVGVVVCRACKTRPGIEERLDQILEAQIHSGSGTRFDIGNLPPPDVINNARVLGLRHDPGAGDRAEFRMRALVQKAGPCAACRQQEDRGGLVISALTLAQSLRLEPTPHHPVTTLVIFLCRCCMANSAIRDGLERIIEQFVRDLESGWEIDCDVLECDDPQPTNILLVPLPRDQGGEEDMP